MAAGWETLGRHTRVFFSNYFTLNLVSSDTTYVFEPLKHSHWIKWWFLYLSESYFHQIRPCNLHNSVSPCHFRLNITFSGIFLHETTFSNVTLVSFKHKNLFTSNMLIDLEYVWSHYLLVAEKQIRFLQT